ncbi:MAG: hypothetical protein WCO56_28205 [Verrucomicrobiota bacterium]
MLLIRIALGLAIIVGVVASYIGFQEVKPKVVTLQEDYSKEQKAHKATQSAKKKVEGELTTTQGELKKEQEAHEGTKNQLSAANTAKAEAEKRVAGLQDDVAKAKAERGSALQELAAWKALGIPVEKIKETMASLETFKTQVDSYMAISNQLVLVIAKKDAQIADLIRPTDDDPERGVPMLGPIKGKVMLVDPKWQFVVLDVGAKNGVVPNGVLRVGRDGKLISKVKIRDVKEDTCVAYIMKGWNLTPVVEGDAVVY